MAKRYTLNPHPAARAPKRELSNQAAAAKMIRASLKTAFPTVTFTIRSSSFSGGDAVDINWTDGPTVAQVDALTRQHQQGHFDGMIDLYEYSNRRDDIPQAKYVMTQREYSDDARRAAVAHVNRYWGQSLRLVTRTYGDRQWEEIDPASDAHKPNGWGYWSDEVNATLYAASMLCPDCGAHTLPGDAYCPQCGHALAQEEDAA